MDAKPQRPVRSLRVKNDENIPPSLQLNKTIHHRNKSSPALSTLLNGPSLKTVPKRTAFGDVSNITNVNRASKDDSIIASKQGLQASGKPGNLLQEKKSAAFLRPAQRPLSVSNLKGLLTGSSNSNPTESTGRALVGEQTASNTASNNRRVLTKRNTTIFRDPSLDPVQEVETSSDVLAASSEAKLISHEQVNTHLEQPAAESRIYLPAPIQEAISKGDPSKDSYRLQSDADFLGVGGISFEAPAFSSDADYQKDTKLCQVAGDLIHKVNTDQRPVSANEDIRAPIPTKLGQPLQSTLKNIEPNMTTLKPIAPTHSILSLPHHYSHPSAPSEPEEYWDDEEEEPYEEEGYVTARSYRSRGDNTTGGATTVLFPQVNQRAQREISAAKKLVDATRTAEEIEDECYDTSMVAEYGDEIFDYMKQLEVKMLPNAHYMDNQHEIQWSMRAVLMDWLVQVHHRFNLLPETLFLCVNYIDRFLSCKVVSLGKLQLVGATAIFIAAKYEEINCPSVQEIVYMVDGGYTVDEVLKAERFMLTMLQFELGWPGPMSFLRRISKADDYDLETRTLAKYFLEVTVMDERFIGSPPSFTAAASHCLARLMLRKGSWTPHHIYYSNYTYSQLRPLLSLMLECCEDPRKHHAAVYNKYCDKRYKRASAFVETEIQRGFQLPNTPVVKNVVQPSMVTFYDSVSYIRA